MANSVVASVVLDPRTLLTHTEFSTETDVSRSETFRLTDAGDGTAGSGVWVGPRPFDYQVEAILPALKLRGVSLAVLVSNPRDSESWRSQISMATSDLAKRLGLSVVILCSGDSPGAIASEAAELLQQNKARQASAIVRLSSLCHWGGPGDSRSGGSRVGRRCRNSCRSGRKGGSDHLEIAIPTAEPRSSALRSDRSRGRENRRIPAPTERLQKLSPR